MSAFAAVLSRSGQRWRADEVVLVDCANLTDIAEVARHFPGELQLVVIEQDDEYAAIVRVDDEDGEPRAFLSDGNAAAAYALAAVVAADLLEIGEDGLSDDGLGDDDTPDARDGAPFGDAEIVEDLGTPPDVLVAMCAREGTLPMDVLVAVAQKAGCGPLFDDLRA